MRMAVNSQLSSAGHGDSNPVASNNTDAGRAKSRRVEIVVSWPNGGAEGASEEPGQPDQFIGSSGGMSTVGASTR
jgi:hypothetical protein